MSTTARRSAPASLDFERFCELAAGFSVVPVWRRLLADFSTPVAAFARMCGDDEAGFLLESVDHGGAWSRWSFVGRRPAARITLRDGVVEVVEHADRIGPMSIAEAIGESSDGVLSAIASVLDAATAPVDLGLPPLHSGLVGYLGYDVVREVERLPNVNTDDQGLPDAVMSAIGEMAAYDHWSQQATLIVNVYVGSGADRESLRAMWDQANERLDRLATDGASPLAEPLVPIPEQVDIPADVTPSLDANAYAAAVAVAKEHILAGDIFQVVLSTRYDAPLDADPFDAYRVLRQINPSPYMYFVREPEVVLVGCSPEPMVQLRDGKVISRPIAGTRFRGRTDEHDRMLAAELAEHPKERAEHIMLVDLARNDVGRVVEYGTCQVDELMSLERYSHVMHLTSQVSGRLRDDRNAVDVIRATLPAGTVSGAPKVRAMEIIDDLEVTKRGPYAGVVGYFDFSGEIDTAIAIRTMVLRRDGDRWAASVQAGAGIVVDSDPADEYLETQNKARALLVAIPAAERMTAARRSVDGGIELPTNSEVR